MPLKTEQMTSLERVVAALTHKEADRVPAAPLVCGASRRVYGVTYDEWAQDAEIAAKSMIMAQKLIGFDAICTLVDLSVEAADFGQAMVYPIEDTPHPVYRDPLIKSVEDYQKIEYVDPRKSRRMTMMAQYTDLLMKAVGQEVAVASFVYGPLGILSMLRSAEKLFLDCMKHPEAVHQALEVVTQTLIDQIKYIGESGVHAIILDTLFASGSIMSKELWKKMEGPYATRLAAAIRETGALVFVHNCGNNVYFDVQIETMQPAAISFAYLPDDCKTPQELKAKYGEKTCLVGYVPPSPDMMLHTPAQVKEACKEQIQVLGPGGGYILSTGCEFPPNGPLPNAIAMVEAAEEYGRYPLP